MAKQIVAFRFPPDVVDILRKYVEINNCNKTQAVVGIIRDWYARLPQSNYVEVKKAERMSHD